MALKVPSQYFKDASVKRLKIKYHFILLSSANIFILIKLVDQSRTKNVGSGGFLVHAEVAVLGVVRLHHCCGHLGRGVDGELKLDLLPVVNTPPLHEEGGESGANSSTKGVEDEEALEALDPVQHQVNNLLAWVVWEINQCYLPFQSHQWYSAPWRSYWRHPPSQ